MAPRMDLHNLLKTLVENVYFQPPPTISLEYPCIIYKRDRMSERRANNKMYNRVKAYQLMIIDRDPDSDLPEQVAELPMCSFDRFYTADNLNHDVYTLFF
jgi:hypothetical protein